MILDFHPITVAQAREIATWRYTGHEKQLFMDPYFTAQDGMGALKGPGGCTGFAVCHERALVGLFEFTFVEQVMWIGMALHPALVGRGHGMDLLQQGIDFGRRTFAYTGAFVALAVDASNAPALKLYQKAGFKEESRCGDTISMRLQLT
ncbi:MAG: GNAT family N-acetyltransferase [Flavobacteriales bacterium]|nr:GNAT family N-acetyltransferase [Flavobacteriales bacterium]